MPYSQVTLSDIISLIRNRMQNSWFWSDQELQDAINEAIRIFQLATGFWSDRYTLTTVARRVIYNTSLIQDANGVPQILMPVRILHNSIPLSPTSVSDMDNGFPGWQLQTTNTSGLSTVPLLWGPMGLNKFFIWPADYAGSTGLQIDAMKRAPVLTSDSDYIDIDSTMVPPILDLIQHTLSFKRSGPAFRSTVTLLQSFFKNAAMRNDHLKVVEPFRSYMGEDSSRRMRPRRAKDISGARETIGVRS